MQSPGSSHLQSAVKFSCPLTVQSLCANSNHLNCGSKPINVFTLSSSLDLRRNPCQHRQDAGSWKAERRPKLRIEAMEKIRSGPLVLISVSGPRDHSLRNAR